MAYPSLPVEATTPRFIRHKVLAQTWLQWTGKRGTEIQALALMGKMDADTLTRLLTARGVTIPECAR